ncbi:Twik (KCNK-like) family of potassium channelsalpha subunit 12 [Aphelenchoides avenae]|nr:Twik (KCNK-like) family of potassium channelsalpha subunit 12 [Aphelenchus avenae]
MDIEAQMFNLDKHGPEPETDPQKQNELNEQLHKKDKRFPIPWALSILMLWILFSAAMFCLWETEWGYLTSIYFFFVSISTVGLGDIVPEKPDMMLVNFVLILIGLALLSMCVDLVQAAIERMLQQLLEEYIQEIEKIAQVVSGGEEFAEEAATPFEVGMTEMLTVPLTSVADQRSGRLMSIGRSAKDWVAGKIASNLLISRLDPYHSSDSEEESEGEAEAVEYLNEGVSMDDMPKIAIHEGTPLRTLDDVRKVSIATRDSASNASVTRRNRHKPAKAHAHLNYNKPTLRAIQVIETAKLRTGRDDNLR